MSDDPYAALGLTRSASDDEIRKAYRRIAKTCHPDLNPGDSAAEKKFKAASAAHDLLKDPEKRARFDRGEIDAQGQERAPRGFYRDQAEQPGNPYRSGRQYQHAGGEGPEFDASDIFAEFLRQRGREGADFGGFGFDPRGGGQGFDARGADRHYTMEVPFLDAVKGGSRRITLPDGNALEVKIPEGTADGQTIRLRGKGAPGYGNGPAGDALVTLTVLPHRFFTREGNDIVLTLPITLDEAVLGGKVTAPTVSGAVSLTVPKGASSGQTLRLRGRGARGRDGKTGDQRVILSIVAPPKVDDDLAEFLRDWRKKHGYDPRKGMTP
jgi:DnaJ-class molecular chaperone